MISSSSNLTVLLKKGRRSQRRGYVEPSSLSFSARSSELSSTRRSGSRTTDTGDGVRTQMQTREGHLLWCRLILKQDAGKDASKWWSRKMR